MKRRVWQVKTWHSATTPLAFPSYCLVSKNHLNTSWSLKTYRRLKNVMVVLEWIPSLGKLGLSAEERPLSAELQEKLAKIFSNLDTNGSGELDLKEVKRALIALEVDEDELVGWGEEGVAPSPLMTAIDTNSDGKISLEELTAAIKTQVSASKHGIRCLLCVCVCVCVRQQGFYQLS